MLWSVLDREVRHITRACGSETGPGCPLREECTLNARVLHLRSGVSNAVP